MGEVPQSSLFDQETNSLISYTWYNFGNFKFINNFKNLTTEVCHVTHTFCWQDLSVCQQYWSAVIVLEGQCTMLCKQMDEHSFSLAPEARTNSWFFFFPPEWLRASFMLHSYLLHIFMSFTVCDVCCSTHITFWHCFWRNIAGLK